MTRTALVAAGLSAAAGAALLAVAALQAGAGLLLLGALALASSASLLGFLVWRALAARLRAIEQGLGATRGMLASDGKRIQRSEKALGRLQKSLDKLDRSLRLGASQQKAFQNRLQRALRDEGRQVEMAAQQARSRITDVPVLGLLPDLAELSVPFALISEDTEHWNTAERMYVVAVCRWKAPKAILEFGTFNGKTTYFLASASPEARVVTVDLPPAEGAWIGSATGKYFGGTEAEARITQILADSRALQPEQLGGTFDFIWIDGGHDYDVVKADTANAFRVLDKGGIVMWHDYKPNQPGLIEFIREFTQDRPLFRIRGTSLLIHLGGIDPEAFTPSEPDWRWEIERLSGPRRPA